MRNALLALVLVTLAAAPAHARLFQAFDFEERQLGNDEDVPMHWSKLAGVDLPHYVVGHLSTDRARSGRYSFRMDLDGGSCVYQYDPARLPAAVGGHYRLTAACQTTPLQHARARLTLALADADGRLIPGSEARSDAYAAYDEFQDWHALSCELTDDDPHAASLIVRVELVQPARYAASSLGDRSLFPEDVRGSAWFDDVVVAQVPRVSLSTDRAGNVFRRGETPSLAAVLEDPSTDDLAAQLIVTDADGRRVYQRTATVDLTAATPVGPGRRRVAVPLPAGPAGWYRATVLLATPGNGGGDNDTSAFTASQSLDYVQLADDGATAPPDPRFGVVATTLPTTAWPALPDVLPLLAVGRVKLAVGSDAAAFNDVVDRLTGRGIGPVGCLPTDAADPTGLVARHMGQVDRWQLGDDQTAAVATDPAARRAYARVFTAMSALSGHADLALPCPMGFELPAGRGQPSALAVSVPPTILPNEIPPYLKDLMTRAGGPTVASVSLRPRDGDADARATDLVQRIVYTMSAGLARVDLPVPLGGADVQPTDLFLVERTLVSALSGTACCGRLPVADGVEAFLFEPTDAGPGDRGVVVLWADATTAGADRPVNVRLGERLTRVDLWGNATPLPPKSPIRVGPVPTILRGVDAPMARFRASVVIDPPTVESVLQPQVRHLRLTNPYAQPIAGIVRLKGPAGWTISPPTVPFELAAGASLDRDVGIDLPTNARAGRNLIVAAVEIQADPPVRLTLPLAMTVGLADVGVQSTAFRDGPVAVVVQQRITNYGEHPVDYTAYVACPGQPRIERLVTALAPGQTMLKRYRLVVTTPAGQPVRMHAGIRETDGPHVLNEELTAR